MKAQAQIITPDLQTAIDNASSSDMLAITITMSEQYDIASISQLLEDMTREERRQFVVRELKNFADLSQQSVMNTITGLVASGQVENVRPLWIVNMIACKAKPSAINLLAQRQDINMIHIDEIYEIGELEIANDDCLENPPAIPYHINLMNVPAVWEMGYEGEGVVVAVLDTGVDYHHPDLEDNLWVDLGWDFMDDDDDPMEIYPYYHGTYVAGTIAGNGNEGSKTGVAPKAKIMIVRVFDNDPSAQNPNFHSIVMAGVGWSVDHGADILNISLGHSIQASGAENLYLWRQTMDNVLATGRVAVVSAGNTSEINPIPNPPNQINVPANVPPPWKHEQQITSGTQSAVVCVGATDQVDMLWYRSCVGPVTWNGIEPWDDYLWSPSQDSFGLIRPDVVAPGVDIVSTHSVLYNNHWDWCYTKKTGTSMSAPAIAGVMALMLSKNPYLLPPDLDEIIEMTAIHSGNLPNEPRKKDNEIGSGRVDALGAIEMVPVCELVFEEGLHTLTQSEVCGIIVKSGATLTIDNDLWIVGGSGKKIIIEPGGKLIVNGAKISGYENKLWKGIEVWGNSTASQATINGTKEQGWLVLENGAIIENAIAAVELWKPGDLSKTGGIVQATDASFINNRNSVHVNNYRNFDPNFPEREMDNVSYFTNCVFDINHLINEEYNLTQYFYKHIDLYKVKGIQFRGCDFSVNSGFCVAEWNSAIASNSAGFTVSAICTSNTTPCSSWDKCTFNGFKIAINASNSLSNNYTFSVIRAEFTDNICGVQVENVNNFSVLFSNFFIGNNDVDEEECEGIDLYAAGYGISSSNATGFAIEENYFTKAQGAPAGNYVGIYIAETQSTDQVYKNTFEGLSYGNYAVGKNWYPDYFRGLAYYCNVNTGNFADFYIEPDNNQQKISGIQSKQGNDNLVTGNRFTTSGANWHFYNGGDYLVDYYFCDYCTNENPDDAKEFQVTDKPKNFSNNCLSHYGCGGESTDRGLVLSPEEKQETEIEFASNLSNYNNVKAMYENLKDGGNTEATITDIETAWPQDMWELRTELLGKSPHLSMKALKATANKSDVLPESVIFEIMAANPDELKKEELIKYLEEKDNPLPNYMISILKQVATGTTYKTVLEQQMAHYNQVKTLAAYDIVRSILNDSVTDFNELRNWLDNIGGKKADEQIIALYLSENNYNDALALANMMPSLYDYSGYEITEHGYYLDMLNLQVSLKQQERSIFDLDSTELSNLVFITQNSIGTAGVQAKEILEYAYGYHQCNCLNATNSSGYKTSGLIKPEDLANVYGVKVSTEPNPAGEWVAFNYILPGDKSEGVIKIFDSKGSFITSLPVSGLQGQKVWDTRKLKSGVYFYTLSVGEFTRSNKIVISK